MRQNTEKLNTALATDTDSFHILREEVEEAIKSLQKGKSASVDNIPGELVQAGGGAMKVAQLSEDLGDRRVANTMDPVFSDHPTQERKSTTVQQLPHHQSDMPP